MVSSVIFEGHQFIKNRKGETEFVVLPIEMFQQLIEMLENYGLAQAMLEAEDDKYYSRDEALRILEEDEEVVNEQNVLA